MKIKAQLPRLLVESRIKILQKSDMSIINSIKYKTYKYLINQGSIKSENAIPL